MQKIYGIDPGNSDLKGYTGGKTFTLKNVIAPGRDRRLFQQEVGELEEFLDVSITSNNEDLGRFFVGDLALQEGGQFLREKNIGSSKASNQDTYVLVLTALAFNLYDPQYPKKTEYISLGSCLPTEEYYTDGTVDKFGNKIKGRHTVKFNHPNFQGAEVSLIVQDLIVIPEGAAAMINETYDEDGNVIKEKEKTQNRLHITVDIGALTVDISAMENGKSIGSLTFGINKGVFNALDGAIEEIAREYNGYSVTRHKLIGAMLNDDGVLPYKQKDIDAKPYIKKQFEELGAEIARQITNKMKRERPNIENEVYATYIVGGGAYSLAEILPTYLNDYQLDFPEDPLNENARGAYKSAKSLLKNSHSKEEKQEESEEDQNKETEQLAE